MSEQDRRRIVVPKREPQAIVSQTNTLVPDVGTLLQDALSVISTEILKFKFKTAKGESLGLSEARVLQGYIKSLVELSKEKRDMEERMDLANMTNEELLKLVQKLTGQSLPEPSNDVE